MDALTALTTRTSAGQLVEPAPDAAQLEKILAAAQRAPDHGRLRPWRFFVVRGAAREKFGAVMADSLKRRDPECGEDRLAAERAKPLRAPLIVVVGARLKTDLPKVPAVEQVLAAGAAADNVMLAAHALGFGCTWKTGPAAYDNAVKAAFGLGPDDALVGFMYLGTPARALAPPPPPDAALATDWTGPL
jgi:nitroreductase